MKFLLNTKSGSGTTYSSSLGEHKDHRNLSVFPHHQDARRSMYIGGATLDMIYTNDTPNRIHFVRVQVISQSRAVLDHLKREVESRKVDYVNSKRLDNPSSRSTSSDYGAANPLPADFSNTTIKPISGAMWGIKKAREKTSQVLREKAPLLRKQQEEQIMEALGQTEDGADTIACPLNSSSMNRGGKGSPGERNVNSKLEVSCDFLFSSRKYDTYRPCVNNF